MKTIDFSRIEFHRQGYALLADCRDKDPGSPICFRKPPAKHSDRFLHMPPKPEG